PSGYSGRLAYPVSQFAGIPWRYQTEFVQERIHSWCRRRVSNHVDPFIQVQPSTILSINMIGMIAVVEFHLGRFDANEYFAAGEGKRLCDVIALASAGNEIKSYCRCLPPRMRV